MFIEHIMQLGAYAAAVSFAISLLIVLSQGWHGKLSHDHDLDGVQKVHGAAVPRIGGLAVVVGIASALSLFELGRPNRIVPALASQVDLLLLVSIPAFIAGIVEDFTKTVPVRVRLSATLLSALLASLVLGATVSKLDLWGVDDLLVITPVAVMVTALVVAGGANAVNIIDGFNGLSSGTLMLMAAGLSFIAWEQNEIFVVIVGTLCIGATFGFFLINYPFGKLFLGDGGAYLLGFLVAEMAVLLLVRCPAVNAWQVLAICAYPVIEVMFSIYRRKFIRKVSPGTPDALHLHTLVYRRVVYPLVRRDPRHLWRRNATVPCVIVPAVGVCIGLSATLGRDSTTAISLVVAQLILYVVSYRRLVHGRWLGRERRKRPRTGEASGLEMDPDTTGRNSKPPSVSAEADCSTASGLSATSAQM